MRIVVDARSWIVGMFIVMLGIACSKRADDCPAPNSGTTDLTTRAQGVGTTLIDLPSERPGPIGFRNEENDVDGGTGGGTISDDGDDEADGEGNKKVRDPH